MCDLPESIAQCVIFVFQQKCNTWLVFSLVDDLQCLRTSSSHDEICVDQGICSLIEALSTLLKNKNYMTRDNYQNR